MGEKVKITGFQIEPKILDKKRNLEYCLEKMREAAAGGANIVAFPEAALSGYMFGSLKECFPTAEPVLGPSTEAIAALCKKLNVFTIVGLLEKDGEKYYNTAALIGPSGLAGKYRKLHLPFLGIDRYVNHGNLPPSVFDLGLCRVGMGICYDMAFPEYSRVLALNGADIVVLITNWPGAVMDPAYEKLAYVRAYENHVYYLTVNRIGVEGWADFFGGSLGIEPTGRLLKQAKINAEDEISIEIDPVLAREKLRVFVPDQLEVHRSLDRRPEFYGAITKPLTDSSRIRR